MIPSAPTILKFSISHKHRARFIQLFIPLVHFSFPIQHVHIVKKHFSSAHSQHRKQRKTRDLYIFFWPRLDLKFLGGFTFSHVVTSHKLQRVLARQGSCVDEKNCVYSHVRGQNSKRRRKNYSCYEKKKTSGNYIVQAIPSVFKISTNFLFRDEVLIEITAHET